MSRLNIAFLGQCHITGYPGVPPDAAFPEVCRRILQAARPDHVVELVLEPYHHPGELERATEGVLRQRPRVVIIEVVGWLAVVGTGAIDLSRLPRGIQSAYERGRHMRRAARTVAEKTQSSGLIHAVRTNAMTVASGLLRPLLPRLPRPTVEDYELCVSEALKRVRAAGATPVVQGPGAGQFASHSKRLPGDAVARYNAVNEMARRVAEANGALYVDRWDTVAAGFFIPGTTRPTLKGQSVWGHLLADQLLRAGVV